MSQSVLLDTRRSPRARFQPVLLNAVRLHDAFFAPRQRINRAETLPGQYAHCESTGRIDNFRRAAGSLEGPFRGWFFNDSDVYKWLEGAAWTLADGPDTRLSSMIDTVIEVIAAAQRPDGYLNTYFTFENADARWTNPDLHELYCAGHLMQAAVAHYRVTGSRRLLDVAVRFADHIDATFGPAESGRKVSADGHPEIEMALVELYRVTDEPRYRQLAQFFIDVRGYGHVAPTSFERFDAAYAQDHRPFRELDRLYGHAVRALYLNGGAADLYLETGEDALRQSLERQWTHMTARQTYISGGLGARWEGEAFGDDDELPHWAYAETCAAIASVMWSWRMLHIAGEARYADLMERTLYNGLLSGLSLDGQTYFYQNPLVDPQGTHRRSPWFEVSCCPTNLARFLPTLGGYLHSASAEGIWVHLYAASEAVITLPDGIAVPIRVETAYPWDGTISLTINGAGTFGLHLRIPAWCESGGVLAINGQPVAETPVAGTYARLHRTWQAGDQVTLTLPMPVRYEVGNPHAAANQGRAAVLRGPLLYCLEAVDNPGVALDSVRLGAAEAALILPPFESLGGALPIRLLTAEGGAVVAVPYYAWANRAPGPMQVYLRR